MDANSSTSTSSPLYLALKQLGLTEQETALYILSLHSGPQPIADLAEQLKISRPNVYKLIQGLEGVGLAALRTSKKRQKRFSVLSPGIIVELLEKKRRQDEKTQREFTQLLPELLGKYKRGDLPSNVRIYQGRGQYLQVFFGMLDEGKDSLDFFGSVEEFLNLIDVDEQTRYLRERVKRGLFSRTLTLPGAHANRIAAEDRENLRETRILQGLDPFSASFHFFADKVIFWQPENLVAIRIEDDLIVSLLRSVYELLWKQSPLAPTSNSKNLRNI